MFTFCPSCASKKITFAESRVFRCPDCGFLFYHNTAASTGCIISVPAEDGERIMLFVRGKEPGIGKLDLPGGFVDPGEGVFEGLHRELREETGWVPPNPEGRPLADIYTLFASYPNVYLYKEIPYNTCDLFFSVKAPGLCERDLAIEKSEISAVLFLRPEEINYDEIAFDSIRRAVKEYVARKPVQS
jgi:8-oxo-dGTP pyrophosphatase MutT (NUDIX family)